MGAGAGGCGSRNGPSRCLRPQLPSVSPSERRARSYDELVAFTVNLTAERDALRADLERTRAEKSAKAKLSAKAAAPRGESEEAAPAIGFTHLELGVMFAMFALLGTLTGGR